MKLDLTIYHYEELIKKGYSLDSIFLLNLIHEQYDITSLLEESLKIKTIHVSLIRKGIITEDNKVTVLGTEILDFISKKTNKKFVKKKIEKSDFDLWWEAFPSTDDFTMGTKRFSGTRGLRVNKEKCRLAFEKIINEGDITKEDIINATLYDVKQRKSNSLKKASNQLTYMQNSLTYLNQRSFEPFIPLSKREENNNFSQPIGSTDI